MRDVIVSYWVGDVVERVTTRFWKDTGGHYRTNQYHPTKASLGRLGRVLKGHESDVLLDPEFVMVRYLNIGRAA